MISYPADAVDQTTRCRQLLTKFVVDSGNDIGAYDGLSIFS